MALRTSLRRGLLSIVVIAIASLALSAHSQWLSSAGKSAVSPALEPALSGLSSSNAFERANAVKALRASHDSAAAPALLKQIDDPDQAVGLYTAQALGELTPAGLLPELRAALSDRNPDVRWRAAMALGELRDAGAVSGLTLALRDGEPLVQRMAGEALAKIGGRAATTALIAALDSAQESTAQAAMAAMESMGEDAVPALGNALTAPQARTRLNAAVVLGYIGSPSARPALQLATIDSDPAVRSAVRLALAQLPQ